MFYTLKNLGRITLAVAYLAGSVAIAQTKKVSDLPAILDTATAAADILYLVDVDAGASGDKKIQLDELSQAILSQRLVQSESSGTNGHEIITNPSINSIAAGDYNSIIGGGYTSFPNLITGTEDLRYILAGYNNEIGAAKACAIVSSYHCGIMDADGNSPNNPGARTVAAGSGHAMIVGGSNHFIDTPNYNIIAGGTSNVITSGRGSGSLGGEGNTLVGDYMVQVGAKDVIFTGLGERSAAIASATLAGADDLDYTSVLSVFNADIDTTDWVVFAADQGGNIDGVSYGMIAGNKNVTVAGGLYTLVAATLDSSINTTGDQHQTLIGAREADISTAGNYSVGMGHGATIVNDNQETRGAGYYTAAGQIQRSRFIVRRAVTGASLTELRYSTSPATGSNDSGRITFTDDDRAWGITAIVVGAQDDETDHIMWEVNALCVIDAGIPSIVGQTVNVLQNSAGASAWACDVFVSDSTDSVSIRCAADAGVTATFVADVTVVEVGD